ncbi:ABC transporter permease [Pseudonocardia nigra]|uniref:ABC transporter permease n=1 Tax=Pseudonocardia nigra TaxID=1921578 RepID=UPI001C5D44F0|nr:ABC transporter permease [Pseudonocardia nigra]
MAIGSPQRRLRAPRAALAFPAWAWFLFFFVAPVALVAWYSFGFKPGLFGTHSNEVLSLDRYREAMAGPFGLTFRNTLEVGLLGTALCLLVGFPFAYWLAVKVPARWRGLVLGLVMVPFWTNFLVRTIGWRLILSGDGTLSNFLQDIGLLGEPLSVLYTRTAVQVGVVYNYLPLMILPLFVALDRMDPALREASKDLGANRWRTLWNVTLPLASPGIAAGLLLVFIPLMGDYITATVLGGARGNMVGQLVASQFQTAQNWALGSAMAVLLILVILATVLVAAVVALGLRVVLRARRRVVLDR